MEQEYLSGLDLWQANQITQTCSFDKSHII